MEKFHLEVKKNYYHTHVIIEKSIEICKFTKVVFDSTQKKHQDLRGYQNGNKIPPGN